MRISFSLDHYIRVFIKNQNSFTSIPGSMNVVLLIKWTVDVSVIGLLIRRLAHSNQPDTLSYDNVESHRLPRGKMLNMLLPPALPLNF